MQGVDSWISIVGALLTGYLLGSVPFGLVLTRVAGLGDIRAVGSGNIGATNVLRTGNKSLAAATLLMDGLKGTLAVLIAGLWGADAALAGGFGAFLGHCFPIWLGFRGGKGVATFLGILLGLHWPAMLAAALIWVITAALSRYSSFSALVATMSAPALLWAEGLSREGLVILALTVLVWVRHHANIRRLLEGSESKIGSRPAAKPEL